MLLKKKNRCPGCYREKMKDEIDVASLARKVLSFFGLELRWITSAKQIWVIEAMTGDLVTACTEQSGYGLFEHPLEAARDRIFLKAGAADDSEIAYRAFIEALGEIKTFVRSDLVIWSTSERSRYVIENPFFGVKCVEELSVRLDLLVPEEKKEDDSKRSCKNS